MANKLKILCAIALCVGLAFAAYEKELANFDKNFANSSQKQKFHNQMRSLYIQSVVNDDEAGKKELLKRLIISSKALNLDSKAYEDELNALNLKAQKEKPKFFVLSSKKDENALVLRLSDTLSAKDIHKTELKEKGNYRYILDFEAALDGGRKEYEFTGAKITLAQFNPQTTRLVINSKNELDYKLNFDNKNLKITLNLPTKSTQSTDNKATNTAKTAQKPANSAPKNSAKNPSPTKTPQAKKNSAQSPKKETLYILKHAKDDDGIELSLSDELATSQIQQFSMRDGGLNRVVLSFEAALEGGRKSYTFGNDTVIITQYSPKLVRVVFSSRGNFKVSKESEGKSLFLGFEREKSATNAKNSASKKQNTKQSATKKQSAKSNTAKKTATRQNEKRQSSQSAVNTRNKTIVIDAGHGGKDGGAVNGKWVEKEIVLAVSLKVGEELRKMGYRVHYTRTKDRYINLRDRTKLANDKKASLFVSIHANAAVNKAKAKTMQGIETFFLSPARSERSKEVAALENQADLEEANYFSRQNFLHSLSREKIIASNRLAIDIQKHILSSVRQKYKVTDGGVREAPFWVLVGAQDMPAVLVEIGYISHSDEGKRLQNSAYQSLLAKGIAQGIQNYFRNNDNE